MSKPTCCIHECGKPLFGNFLCSMHYNRMYRHGSTIKPEVKRQKCRWPSCDKAHKSSGWCDMHYARIVKPKISKPCVIEGCGRHAVAKFLCGDHYGKLRDHGTTHPRKREQAACRMPGCDKPSRKNRWCQMHADRIKRNGSPFDKDQSWTVVDHNACVVCGGELNPGNGFRRYCGQSCAVMGSQSARLKSRLCNHCGTAIDMTARSKSGRLRYSNATRCTKCRAPRLTHLVPTIVERDGIDCGLCGDPVDLALVYPDPMSRSVDHILPRSRGGADDMSNYQLSHLRCNVMKNNRVEVLDAVT